MVLLVLFVGFIIGGILLIVLIVGFLLLFLMCVVMGGLKVL